MSEYWYSSGWVKGETEAKLTLRFDEAAWNRDCKRLIQIEERQKLIKSNINAYNFFVVGNPWLDLKIYYHFKPGAKEELDSLFREWKNLDGCFK